MDPVPWAGRRRDALFGAMDVTIAHLNRVFFSLLFYLLLPSDILALSPINSSLLECGLLFDHEYNLIRSVLIVPNPLFPGYKHC